MATRIKKDDITPALKNLLKSMDNKRNIQLVANTAKAIIVNRTLMGQSLNGGGFKPYSKKIYYAPIDRRVPGTPAPTGGRNTRVKSGKKMKSMVFEGGYGQYKSALGRGGVPQLSLTNKMLSSMQVYVMSVRKAVIFFSGALSNAKAHGLHHGKFPFFGLRQSETKSPSAVLVNQLIKIKGMRKI
jgi:hypothetical protein